MYCARAHLPNPAASANNKPPSSAVSSDIHAAVFPYFSRGRESFGKVSRHVRRAGGSLTSARSISPAPIGALCSRVRESTRDSWSDIQSVPA